MKKSKVEELRERLVNYPGPHPNERLVIEFFLPMEHVPTITHQEHKVMVRNGRPIFYEPPELQAVRQKYRDMLTGHRPAEKLTGPLHLHVVWCFLTNRHPDGAWRDTKPDTDNLQKLLKDCMTAVGFWEDDAQVCSELVEKRWIPVTERLPETTDPVNVTWVNKDPVSYYEDIRGKRFTATACYHKGKWWWYSAVCQDLLDEYGKSCMDDEIDEAIEILAWRPLPAPYQEDEA